MSKPSPPTKKMTKEQKTAMEARQSYSTKGKNTYLPKSELKMLKLGKTKKRKSRKSKKSRKPRKSKRTNRRSKKR